MLFQMKFLIILYSIYIIRDCLLLLLKQKINIDNPMVFYYEDNIDFFDYSTTIKPIAIYNSNENLKNYNLNIYGSNINNSLIALKKLEEDINFAKSHGIYGFAFYYIFINENNSYIDNLKIILNNKYLKIHFLLIFENSGVPINDKDFNISKIYLLI